MDFNQEQKNLRFPLEGPFLQSQEHREAVILVYREQSTKETSMHIQACLKTLGGRPQAYVSDLYILQLVSCLSSRGTSASSTVMVWTLPKQICEMWNNSILINYSLKRIILICPNEKYSMTQRIFKKFDTDYKVILF